MQIQNVAIVGGTHGNELTGVYLLKRWAKLPEEICRSSFSTHTFMGNPKAYELNRRFVDEDLNRCFANSTLASSTKTSYESHRAVFLNQLIGPKEAPRHDFVIDLHTSTSNCGAMIILTNDDPFNLALAAYILLQMPEARIHIIPPIQGESPYLSSLSNHGLVVEVGPIPQGLLCSDAFHLSTSLVRHALDFAHAINEGHSLRLPDAVEVYRFKEAVYYPVDGDAFAGFVHDTLQGADYLPLHPGAPLFETVEGGVITYEGTDTVYPVFVNEAAYYYKGIAMSLCTKELIPVSPFEEFTEGG